MGLLKPKNPPDTISDEEMDDLRRRALKAHPEMGRFDTSKEALRSGSPRTSSTSCGPRAKPWPSLSSPRSSAAAATSPR